MNANVRYEFLDSFWILRRGLKRRACVINLSAFHLSCSPRSLVVWPNETHWDTQDGGYGGSTPIESSDFELCVCTKILSKLCTPVAMKSKNFTQENVKNCTPISHFASSPNPLLGICPRPYWGMEVPRLRAFYTILYPPHGELLGMPMVKPIPITIPSRLLLAVAPPDTPGKCEVNPC